jgi:hypothetical protein
MQSDPIRVIRKVSDAFEQLGIPYLIGSSIASTLYGISRATQDVDFVADMRMEHVDRLVACLKDEFYIDDEMIREAIRRRTSFNVIHLSTLDKADVFIPADTTLARLQFERRQREPLGADSPDRMVYFASPEDTVLEKLRWYAMGAGISDRQWGDLVGVLKLRGGSLDLDYLRHWTGELGLGHLLERALAEAGLPRS